MTPPLDAWVSDYSLVACHFVLNGQLVLNLSRLRMSLLNLTSTHLKCGFKAFFDDTNNFVHVGEESFLHHFCSSASRSCSGMCLYILYIL